MTTLAYRTNGGTLRIPALNTYFDGGHFITKATA